VARKRTIAPGFFKNEDLGDCSPLARLLFAGLWCWADRLGRLEDRPRRLRAEILPYDDSADGEALVAELASRGFVERYEVNETRVLQIVNFRTYQDPHPREALSTLPNKDGSMPEQDQGQPKANPGRTQGEPGEEPSPASPSSPSSPSRSLVEEEAAGALALTPDLPPKPVSPLVAFLRQSFPDIRDPWACEEAWVKAYPAVDLLAEAMRALAWETSNPRNRKANHARFLNSWLARSQDKGGTKAAPQRVIAPAAPITAFVGGKRDWS
jgi:hypothetical protein